MTEASCRARCSPERSLSRASTAETQAFFTLWYVDESPSHMQARLLRIKKSCLWCQLCTPSAVCSYVPALASQSAINLRTVAPTHK